MYKKRGRRIKYVNLIYFLILILLTNIVMAECVEPQDGMFVNQDIVFCKGTYHLNKEISITRNNINIDCKKTTITGDKTNIGFLIENSINTTIENCVLMNFIIGIQVSKSTNINLTNNTFLNNSIGIKLDNVNKAILNNKFISNIENLSITHKCIKDNFCLDNCNGRDPDCKILAKPATNRTFKVYKENIADKNFIIKKSTIRNIASQEVVEEVPIRTLDHKYASHNINLIKTKEIKDNKTIIEIKLITKSNINGLVIYEHFSKESVKHVNLISSQHDFKVIEEDPVIKFEIKKDLELGSEQTIIYEVNKIIDGQDPISIITIETKGVFIKWLLSLSITLYLIFVYVNRRLKSRYKGLTDFVKSSSYRFSNSKLRLLNVGWPEYQIDEAISLLKEEQLSNTFKKIVNFLRSFSAEILLLPYIYIFGLPDLNMRILPSEIITVVFFSVVNGGLLLLIIHKSVALLKWRRTH
jgi:parallel beta-helix repeat protein